MDVNAIIAGSGYAAARPATAAVPGSGDGAYARFAASFTEAIRGGEETAMAAMTGRADPHALVQALAASELAIETAVTLRDKVVEAYQEILRMPV